jgi:hypothetical protein
MRNPSVEWNSAGNYQQLDEESTGKMEFYRNYQLLDVDSDRKDLKSSKQVQFWYQ